jgi:hypothetical protein
MGVSVWQPLLLGNKSTQYSLNKPDCITEILCR